MTVGVEVLDRYGNKLPKKHKKAKPSYWRLLILLKRLRLKYKERSVENIHRHVIVPEFGIVFRFNHLQPITQYRNWDIIDVNLKDLEIHSDKFFEELMWLLISKGYMAYIKDPEKGYTQFFHELIVRKGWGLKIIDKRLELFKNEPRHMFFIKHNRKLRDKSISYILAHYPDFFDYLC